MKYIFNFACCSIDPLPHHPTRVRLLTVINAVKMNQSKHKPNTNEDVDGNKGTMEETKSC